MDPSRRWSIEKGFSSSARAPVVLIRDKLNRLRERVRFDLDSSSGMVD